MATLAAAIAARATADSVSATEAFLRIIADARAAFPAATNVNDALTQHLPTL